MTLAPQHYGLRGCWLSGWRVFSFHGIRLPARPTIRAGWENAICFTYILIIFYLCLDCFLPLSQKVLTSNVLYLLQCIYNATNIGPVHVCTRSDWLLEYIKCIIQSLSLLSRCLHCMLMLPIGIPAFAFIEKKNLLCMLISNQKASFMRKQICCFHSWLLCHGEEASLIDHAFTLRLYLSCCFIYFQKVPLLSAHAMVWYFAVQMLS